MTQKHSSPPPTEAAARSPRKKIWAVAAGIAGAVIILFLCVWFFFLKNYLANRDAPPVFVTSVSSITGTDLGYATRYAGIVEPQKTIAVNKDESKKVAQILVTEGQNVAAGDPLFSYDIDEMKLTLEQDKLSVESINNTIDEYKNQIAELEKERDNAPSDSKLSYTIKIQTLELNIKEQEYQASLKNKEIDKLNTSIENNTVTAPEAGIIKSINDRTSADGGMPNPDPSGGTQAFISILSTGEYRIKSTITELQRYQISQGQSVMIHSRINPEITWSGTVESVDFENPVSNENGNYYMSYASGGGGEGSSRYYFYVVLEDQSVIADSTDGITELDENKLIIGQHVYIEPNTGAAAGKAGLWLPADYIGGVANDRYVWVQNKHQKLEKRTVLLGEQDEESGLYEVTSGLDKNDYLAWPDENLREGMRTTTDAASLPIDGALMPEGETLPEGGAVIPEEGVMPEGGDVMQKDAAPEEGAASAGEAVAEVG